MNKLLKTSLPSVLVVGSFVLASPSSASADLLDEMIQFAIYGGEPTCCVTPVSCGQKAGGCSQKCHGGASQKGGCAQKSACGAKGRAMQKHGGCAQKGGCGQKGKGGCAQKPSCGKGHGGKGRIKGWSWSSMFAKSKGGKKGLDAGYEVKGFLVPAPAVPDAPHAPAPPNPPPVEMDLALPPIPSI